MYTTDLRPSLSELIKIIFIQRKIKSKYGGKLLQGAPPCGRKPERLQRNSIEMKMCASNGTHMYQHSMYRNQHSMGEAEKLVILRQKDLKK